MTESPSKRDRADAADVAIAPLGPRVSGVQALGASSVADAILGGGLGGDHFLFGMGVALALHAGMLSFAVSGQYLAEMRSLMQATRVVLHDYFWTQYEVDLAPKEKEKPKPDLPKPPEPPEPDPPAAVPVPKAAPRPKDAPTERQAPTPAQAAKVLTKLDDPNKIEDLTSNTAVTGDGTVTHGMQSALGTGNTPTTNPNASLKGVPGGRGAATVAPVPPAPTGPDLSRAASIEGGTNWKSCPFPAEADAEQIDSAVVGLVVTVRPDGTPLSASVTSDPGHGFGRAARMCALARHYAPAFDRAGGPITSATAPFNVRFTR